MNLKQLSDGFRDPQTICCLADRIRGLAAQLDAPLQIMEVCGGHTHAIMKYGLNQLMPDSVGFIHGPGCPVCVMPKERVDEAYVLAMQPDVILTTLGDMIKVPGSLGSLQQARSKGADVRFVYSPLDAWTIAQENPEKTVIFFAIGFETTTPMTAALLQKTVESDTKNLLFHINHITVPEPVNLLLDSAEAQIDAFIGPSHVSVISGAKIYRPWVEHYRKPTVVCGFEPVDVLEGVVKILTQRLGGRCELEIQYTRSTSMEGNLKAQALMERFFTKRESFRWRGLGDIPSSAWRLKEEFVHLDAEIAYADCLPKQPIDDHKQCICGAILRGVAKPQDCSVFGTACTPQNPLGSCMVSSEGACAAYYRYGRMA